jgi:hypothetical protein
VLDLVLKHRPDSTLSYFGGIFRRCRHGSILSRVGVSGKVGAVQGTKLACFDDKILSLYARGMIVREIQAHLQEMYGTEVSPSLISSATDAVKASQARSLDLIYPIVYLD